MKRKFIMMETWSWSVGVVEAGNTLQLTLLLYDNSPPYSSALYSSHPCMVFYNVPDINGLAGE